MITVFVDASHCPRTRAGGWGAWAKGDGWERGITFGGALKVTTNNSSEAEIAALAAALQALSEQYGLKRFRTVMLQSDNLRALQLIYMTIDGCRISNHAESADIPTNKLHPTPTEKNALRIIHAILQNHQTYVRHVRGHQSGEGRNWVNRTCDDIAKRHMRQQRGSRQGHKPKRKEQA